MSDDATSSEPEAVTGEATTAPGAPRVASAVVLGLATLQPRGEVDAPGGPDDYRGLHAVAPDHYRFGELIAEGGMGRIRRARDRRLGRDVAVKEVRDASPELAARLEREARITARLDHPSIVSVHEAGVWLGGQPFFAMEIVSGRALDEAIGEARSPAERLALLPHAIAAADAIAYAHACGIIHRDLKPGNIMVGAFGETVVIDWGLAKDLASSSDPDPARPDSPTRSTSGPATAYGSLIGTPEYMAPEQARGEPADPRADVFAIGALLFHLLAGRPPFQGKDRDDVLDQVIADAPVPLESLAPDAPPDLIAIVHKAMAHDREARYPSARELAEDLRRFQTGQLVAARRYSAMQRVRRLLARHRVVVGVVAAATLVVAVVSVVGAVRIVRERDAAIAAGHEAERQHGLAEQRRSRVEKIRVISEDLVGSMLTKLKPQLARVGRLDAMRGVSTEIGDYYQQLADAHEELDDGSRARRAVALRTLGDVFDDYGDITKATRAYQAALAVGASLTGADAALEAARARIGLAQELEQAGELAAAVTELDQARAALDPLPAGTPGVELVRAVAYRRLGGVHLKGASGGDGMAELATALAHATAAAAGGDRDARAELARIHDRLSDAGIPRSDLPGALDQARAGLAIREQLATQEPGDLENQLGVATSWDKLSRIAIRNNDPRAAGEAADHEAQVIARLVERDPDNARWGRLLMLAYQRRAEAEEAAEHYAAAAASIRSAIAAAQRLLDLDPSNVDRQWDVNSLTSKLASHLTYAHRPDEALAVLRRALPAAQALLAKVPANLEYQRNIGILHEYMGDILSEQHKYQDAVDEYRLRLRIDEDLARRRPDITIYRFTVAMTQFLMGDTLVNLPAHRDEAIAVMTDALAKLHALRDAGQLNKEALAGMAEREAELAAKQRRSAQ